MIISKEDKNESLRVVQLIKKIELIDEKYVNKESDLLSKKQPFLISLLLGYRFDLKELELEEILKIIFLIWEFFKNHSQIEQMKISESQFMRIQQKNIHMLKYLEGEQGKNAKMEFISTDLENLKSKSLFTGIIFQFNEKIALLDMNNETRGIILVGLKSLIECFEEIVFRK
ncbi:MAG: hypothetical protein PF481_02665 [Bacteroidales bacterium]|jgi:hypothetical protein|nr:hypothetical protein [Bacteroidales bacterium]